MKILKIDKDSVQIEFNKTEIEHFIYVLEQSPDAIVFIDSNNIREEERYKNILALM